MLKEKFICPNEEEFTEEELREIDNIMLTDAIHNALFWDRRRAEQAGDEDELKYADAVENWMRLEMEDDHNKIAPYKDEVVDSLKYCGYNYIEE